MKLNDFEGEKAFEVAAKIYPLIMRMRYNGKTREFMKSIGDNDEIKVYDIFAVMLQNEPKAAIELFAALNDKPISEFKFTAATMLNDIINTFAFDDELMSLFGLRVQKTETVSSGLATGNTEAVEN